MVKKSFAATALAIAAMFLLVVKVVYDTAAKDRTMGLRTLMYGVSSENNEALLRLVIQQRNNISRQLNLKQQRVGQMECEKLGDKGAATSNTGGWCMKSSTEGGGDHQTDAPLATALIEFFTGKRVASFGDGPGRYKQLLLDSGKVNGYDAYDGAPFTETTSEGRVKFLDLTLPQYGLPVYDWVMSLEVAEHIPAAYESIYIDNVVRHASEGVVLSWARLGQGGYSHVNNRAFEYVKELMERLGFTHDEAESQKIRKQASLPWMQTNINVYRRRTPLSNEAIMTST